MALKRERDRLIKETEDLGPAVPQFEAPRRPCPKCGVLTVNRYQCRTCNNQDVFHDNVRGQLMTASEIWGVSV